jgi:mono/diheme cytochrome c family protein
MVRFLVLNSWPWMHSCEAWKNVGQWPRLKRSFCSFMFFGFLLTAGFVSPELEGAENESGNELPPLSEARAVGRLKSLYLKQAAVTKPPPSAGVQTANLDEFKSLVSPAFKTTCVTCHGAEKQKGKFRIDTLDPDLIKGKDINKWLEVMKLVSNGEMPPEDAKDIHLDDQQRNAITSWLGAEIQKASQVRVSEQGFTSFRRMTRYEYNYAIQDLIGLPYDFVDLLPPETASEDGFLNSSHLLQMSGMQFERYRELSLKALQKATIKGERPKMVAYIVLGQDLKDKDKDKDKEKGDYKPKSTTFPDAQAIKVPAVSPVVFTLKSNQSVKLNLGTTLPDEGIMRVRIRASGQTTTESNKNLSLRLIINAQTSNNAHFSEIISKRDIPVTAPSDKPEFIQFEVPLSEITRNPYRHGGGEGGVRNEEFLVIQAINGGGNQGIQADYIDICAPFYE